MTDSQDTFDDDLGPDILNRGGGKFIGGGHSEDMSPSGSYMDPSYEDALHILGRSHEIPPPFIQMALTMDNAEAADLAHRLTALRQEAGVGFGSYIIPPDQERKVSSVSQEVQIFVAALQKIPPDLPTLEALYQTIAAASDEIRLALENVCEHESIQSIMAGDLGRIS